MKPAPFEYDVPRSPDEAVALLAEYSDDVKVIAGGQSLVPLLNFRLARPARLVDVNRLGELAYVRRRDGVLHVGALTRQATLERSRMVAQRWPIVADAMRVLAHPQIRNRGTIGGSVAHADPSAELPVVFSALGARMRMRSARGERTLGCDEFFITHLTSALEQDELLTEIEIPPLAPRTGSAFVEYARRHGDFALGGAAAVVTLDEAGRCERAAIALLAAADTPLRRPGAEALLVGSSVDEEAVREAAERAVADIEPTGDIHGGTEYRRLLIGALVRRALLAAAQRADGTSTREEAA